MPEWHVPGYTGLRSLGSGGFGEVILARHNASGTLVAIKYLRPAFRCPMLARSLQWEARATAVLRHSTIVRVLDWGLVAPDDAYIVEGRPLDSRRRTPIGRDVGTGAPEHPEIHRLGRIRSPVTAGIIAGKHGAIRCAGQ